MIGVCLGTGSYLALNQSGITTARRSSWIVIPRARASSLRRVYVCSPKATMTLYDVFSSRSQFSNIQRDVSNTLFYVLGARHIRITEVAARFLLFSKTKASEHVFYHGIGAIPA